MSLSAIKEDDLALEIAALRKSASVSTVSAVSEIPVFDDDGNEIGNLLQWEDVYKGDITKHHLEEIKHELGLIEMCWDKVPIGDGSAQYPSSYLENTQKEKLLLWLANNFRQQFHIRFPKRRPLLLACKNECGITKMVCTTIRPTRLRQTGLQSVKGCASFVADYLQYVPLINVTALPDQLVSPGEVLARQTGHSYEFATLLTSLLIGASYNAFVVSGYATRERCINDTTRQDCPYISNEEENNIELSANHAATKYMLEPPRDLQSKFLLEQQEKETAREAAAKQAQAKAETKALMEFESPPPDPLWTHRRHAWVLLLPSKDVTEPCFLDPASGTVKSLDDPQYHGIDSIWNHQNYWVAVGDKRLVPCKDMKFELENPKHWQQLLWKKEDDNSKSFDMPASWVSNVTLSNSDYERRYVDCQKIVKYRKCTVQSLAPYSDTSGMVTRVTNFNDYDCTIVQDIREEYKFRADSIFYIHSKGDEEHHRFRKGRPDALKEYKFKKLERGLPVELEMEFYHTSRQDGLLRLVKEPSRLCEEFKNRFDFLYHRVTLYNNNQSSRLEILPISKITEKYARNKDKKFSEDVAKIEYDFEEQRVNIVYHYGEENISSHRRELCLQKMKQIASYDPDPYATPLRPLNLHYLLQECSQKKDNAEISTRNREQEIQNILLKRSREMAEPELLISLFDEGRNQEARQQYKERDRKLQEERARDLSLSVDLLAPYLTSLPTGSVTMSSLPAEDARKVHASCLQDWKTILLTRATDIQRQFNDLAMEMRNDAEENKTRESDERLFKLHCLQIRLQRHKELAPQRYLAIDACLRADHRLFNAFHTVSLWPKLSASIS